MSPALRGPALDRRRARRPRSAAPRARWSTSSGGTSASAHGTSSVVQSATSTFGCTVDGGGEAERSVVGGLGQRRSRTAGCGDRAGCASPAAAFRNQPLDVALDRLGVQPLLADARDEHLPRHLALAEAGDLDARGEVGGRVLDGVLDVVRRHVDRQADLVLGELLDAHGHGGHRSRAHHGLTAEGISAGGGTRTPKGLAPHRDLNSAETGHPMPAPLGLSRVG